MELSDEQKELVDFLCKQVHHWSLKKHSLVLNQESVLDIIKTLVETHNPVWIKGDPQIKFGNEEYFLDQFVEIITTRLLEKPGLVDGTGFPFGGVQDPNKTAKNMRYDNSVSCQLLLRILRANPNRWFTVDELGEELDILKPNKDLNPSQQKKRKRDRKKIRRYIQNIRRYSPSIKTRQWDRRVQYCFVNK